MARYSMRSEPGKLTLVVPAFDKSRFVIISLIVLFFLFIYVRSPRPLETFARILFPIILVLSGSAWLWNLFGKEELEFTASQLTRHRVIFWRSITDVYQQADIQGPHFVVRVPGRRGRSSSISFTCEGKTENVCSGITQSEAKQIVGAVLDQFPELTPIWGRYVEGVFDLK
jgi:hypothetical protein